MEKRTTLIIGLAIPVVMMLFVAGSIYLPGLFVKPHFSFIYLADYNGGYTPVGGRPHYEVNKDGKLIFVDSTPEEKKQIAIYYKDNLGAMRPPTPSSAFYKYDVTTDSATKITLEEAQMLTLDGSAQSPDGFELVRGGGGGDFFPFFYNNNGDYNARYLSGHNTSKRLNLVYPASTPDYYYQEITLLGWIIK